MSEGKDLIIRNSTAEFLIFEKQAHADSIEVRYEDETLWLTQKMMSNLFDVESNTITYHLQEIFKSGELDKESTARKFRVVQTEGIDDLEHIVSAFLDIAENRAKRKIPMTMEDWASRIDKFLLADDRDILENAGKISAEIAKEKAESEFEMYRVIQDKTFKSDFDLFSEEALKLENKKD